MKAFMMIFNPTGYNTISPIFENIAEQVSNYIEITPHSKVVFTRNNFSIEPYNSHSEAYGLKGNYDDFFLYTDLNTNKNYIISQNEEKIKAFCAYINRLTC